MDPLLDAKRNVHYANSKLPHLHKHCAAKRVAAPPWFVKCDAMLPSMCVSKVAVRASGEGGWFTRQWNKLLDVAFGAVVKGQPVDAQIAARAPDIDNTRER